MGNINCCKKPDEIKKDEELLNDEEINQLDNDGFPHDSIQVKNDANNQNEEAIKPLPNNEEIEEGPSDQVKEEEQKAQNYEEEQSDQNQKENKEEEQNPQNEEGEEPKVEDAAKKAYEQEENAAVIRSQNQNAQESQEQEEKNENENEQYEQEANEAEQAQQEQEIEQQEQEQVQEQEPEQEVEQQEQELPQKKVLEVEQQLEEPQDKILLRQQQEEEGLMQEASINANYAGREIVQEEQIQQQPLEQYDEQKNYEINLQNINYQDNNNYNEIVDTNAISQTNFVSASTPIPTQNINISTTSNAQPITHTVVHPTITTTNVQQPIVFKDANELNKYFESIGTNAYNQVASSLNNTSANVNEFDNLNLNSMNINTNTNEEDLNKYFQPNAYTQNDNNFQVTVDTNIKSSADFINILNARCNLFYDDVPRFNVVEIKKQTVKQPKTLTEQEEEIEWNKWRSNLQNQIMKDVKLPIIPQGTVFKFVLPK